MKFEIKNQFSGAVQYECELSAEIAGKGYSLQLGFAVRKAVSENADLSGADLRDADLRGADLRGADLSGADLSGAKSAVFEAISKTQMKAAICAQVCAAPEKLEMDSWHTCDTVHCIAGWTTTLHPQGKLLESIYGTSAAAALILHVCEGEVPSFHSSNETAMQWLKGEN